MASGNGFYRGGSGRTGGRPGRWGGRLTGQAVVATAGALAVCATLMGAASPASATPHRPSAPPHTAPVPVTPVTTHYGTPRKLATSPTPKVSWPSGTATVTVPGTADTTASAQPAGTLPVWIAPVRPAHKAAARTGAAAAAGNTAGNTAGSTAGSATAPVKVSVDVLPRDRARAAGVSGVLLALDPAGAAASTATGATTRPATGNGSARGSKVRVTLGYGAFASAFGGDWASRLHLVALPACVLTTPQLDRCRTQTALATADDTKARTLSASVDVPAAAAAPASRTATTNAATTDFAAARPMTVLAAVSSAGGGGGDFSATTLKGSSSWQAGGSSDAFDWTYPMAGPAVPGSLSPSVQIGYDSQSVDGLTSSTNNQASVVRSSPRRTRTRPSKAAPTGPRPRSTRRSTGRACRARRTRTSSCSTGRATSSGTAR